MHFLAYICPIRVLATEMACLTVDDESYYVAEEITVEMLALSKETMVQRYSAAGVPLWPPVQLSAFAGVYSCQGRT
jgi:hypothetical protein